ncbi:MAG: hypothetical protein BRD43_02235, partial [Bacteroidetes bacterium QS_4_64_154]
AVGQPDTGDVVINEIMYAPSPSTNEFIELYNRAETAVALDELALADANQEYEPVTVTDTTLAPGEYVVLVRDAEAFEAAFPSVPFLAPDGWAILNNGGDTVFLRHSPSDTPLDSVPYAPSWGGSDGRSLERIDPRGPSNRASNFASSTAPAGATPGAQNSRYAPDTTPPQPVFAEQVDSTVAEVVFNEPVQGGTIQPSAFQVGETTVTQTALSADSIARLSLSETPTAATVVVTDVRDLVGNRREQATLSLARRPTPEYVELVNLAAHPLTLSGLVLTDRPTEEGTADTIQAGRRRAVSPGAFAVVAAAPDGATPVQESQLAAAFPDAPLSPDSVAYLPVDATRLGLRNDGDLIRVHRRDRTVVAKVDYVPDWHAPGLAETKGTALERISPTADADAADNWTSSTAPSGGTPGTPNDVSLAPPDDAPEAAGLRIQPDPFSIERDKATRIHYSLADVPNLVRARIYDARGRQVRTLEEARLAGRSGELVWDGRDDAGDRVRIGPYVVFFEAVRAKGGTITQLKETVVVARPLN